MPKYRVYIHSAIRGPFEIKELLNLPGFTLDTTVCVDGESDWMPAREFAAIVHYDKSADLPEVIESGDYRPQDKQNSRANWRESIIPSNAPDLKRYVPVASVSSPKSAVFPEWNDTDAVVEKVPNSALVSLSKLNGAIAPRRRAILMVWGLVSFGVCYPGAETFLRLYDVLPVPHQERILARQGSRFRGGLISKFKIPALHLKKETTSVKEPVRAKVKIEKPVRPVAPPSDVEELESEDLGNGYIMKTVVVTTHRGGFKTQETKTIVIPKKSRHHHGR